MINLQLLSGSFKYHSKHEISTVIMMELWTAIDWPVHWQSPIVVNIEFSLLLEITLWSPEHYFTSSKNRSDSLAQNFCLVSRSNA